MAKPSPFTEGEKDQLVKEYLAGASPAELAEKYYYNEGTISYLMKCKGVRRTKNEAAQLAYKLGRGKQSQFTVGEIDQLVKEYLDGASSADLAEKYSFTKGSIAMLMRRRGVIRGLSEAIKLAIKQGKIIRKGEDNYRWVKDRSKLKRKRDRTLDQLFVAKVLKERLYICELTDKTGGQLSVHHIKPVWSHPELQFDKDNVIVIQTIIHKEFHRIFGVKTNVHSWNYFVKAELYKKVI